MSDITPQLLEQVREAAESGTALAISGGGSKAFMGRGRKGEPLSLADHTGVVSYHPVELVLTVRAGTRLSEIDAVLAEHNQRMAFDPPRFSDSDVKSDTIGGTLACNLSGPGRPWQGSVRDHVLGVKLINGQGQHLSFGGQVMKNVAGYDASRLQAGALGTLGVMTEISLKVLPLPAVELTLSRELPLAEAHALMAQLAGQPKPLSAACWVNGTVYLRLSGARSAVDATAEQWQQAHGLNLYEAGSEFWALLRDQQLEFFAGDRPLWRFSVNPTAPMQDIGNGVLVDWGGGQRWSRAEASLSDMAAYAARAGGQVSLFRGGDRSGEVMHPQPAPLRTIQQRLKASFDPRRIFNPGHLYSWL
ncbi:glycolate oxidase subunit GlcE [uncultured Marinobacter sp.]|uniref:glycolate oxidase subunit GlcE n=1 Tax=uncultured Marinobacter sp. TaxID=187379 RepID=UPI0030DC27F5